MALALAVSVSVSYAIQSTLTINNSATSSSNGSANSESCSALSVRAFSGINAWLNSQIDLSSVAIGGSVLNPAALEDISGPLSYSLGAGGSTSGGVHGSHSLSLTTKSTNGTTPAGWGYFEAPGGGLFDVGLTTLTGTSLSNTGGNTSASQVTTATGTFGVQYFYTPTQVPEPAPVFIMGSGLVGLGVVGLRRRKAR